MTQSRKSGEMDQQNKKGTDLVLQNHPFSPSSIPIIPSSPRSYRLPLRTCPASPPRTAVVTRQGQTLIAPNSTFARAVVMGNAISEDDVHRGPATDASQPQQARCGTDNRVYSRKPQPVSNLTVLLSQHDRNNELSEQRGLQQIGSKNGGSPKLSPSSWSPGRNEADSASGPPPPPPAFGRSAPDLRPPAPFSRQLLASKSLKASTTAAPTQTNAMGDKVRK